MFTLEEIKTKAVCNITTTKVSMWFTDGLFNYVSETNYNGVPRLQDIEMMKEMCAREILKKIEANHTKTNTGLIKSPYFAKKY